MGCDIHMYAEIFEGGKWEVVGTMFKDESNHKEGLIPIVLSDGFECRALYTKHPYDERNYSLFAILAGVRNGVGFALYDTGDGFNPISEPRGLPKDASSFIKRESTLFDCGWHSHSWLTLKELKSYNWHQTTKIRGYVSKEQKKEFKYKGEKPKSRCSWTNQKGYTQLEWDVTYRECCEKFLEETISQLEYISSKVGGDENVRIVFWFDN